MIQSCLLYTSITWDDQDNAALARPAKVEVMLYADGVPLTDQTAIITAVSYTHLDVYKRQNTRGSWLSGSP